MHKTPDCSTDSRADVIRIVLSGVWVISCMDLKEHSPSRRRGVGHVATTPVLEARCVSARLAERVRETRGESVAVRADVCSIYDVFVFIWS